MPFIHHVEEAREAKYVIDPIHGMTMRTDVVVRPSTTHTISHDGETYHAQDGTFDVPGDVAAFFLGRRGWAEGPNPFAELEQPAPKAKASRARKSDGE